MFDTLNLVVWFDYLSHDITLIACLYDAKWCAFERACFLEVAGRCEALADFVTFA